VQVNFEFRGAKNTAAGRTLTVTLTNDLDGTVCGGSSWQRWPAGAES
jgi:hypothetical protein